MEALHITVDTGRIPLAISRYLRSSPQKVQDAFHERGYSALLNRVAGQQRGGGGHPVPSFLPARLPGNAADCTSYPPSDTKVSSVDAFFSSLVWAAANINHARRRLEIKETCCSF